MRGYKAFNKGLVCKNKQYSEDTIFEEESIKICKKGMHFCKNPLDVLDYYPLIDDNGNIVELAEVEALGQIETDDDKKYCTDKLKIAFKLDLSGLINASVSFILEKINQNASSGDASKNASSGDYNQNASSGDDSKNASSGDYNQNASSGYYSKNASSGDYSKNASSGYDSSISMTGKNNVGANIGVNGVIKGVKGSWITLAEYNTESVCVCVKSTQIDGEIIKENIWYKLKDEEFAEV